MITISKLFMISMLLTCLQTQSKTIIWDIGCVLFAPSSLRLAPYMIADYPLYRLLEGKNTTAIKMKAFELLERLEGKQNTKEKTIIKDATNTPLPSLFVTYQLGLTSSKSILEKALSYADKCAQEHFFSSDRECRLVKNALCCMFDPQILAQAMRPIDKTIEILKACKAEGHRLCILSNFDIETFTILYTSEHGREIFDYFDKENIFISGVIQKIKPHQDCFEHLLSTLNINPTECIFIDDQQENRAAAENLGIMAFDADENLYNHLVEYEIIQRKHIEIKKSLYYALPLFIFCFCTQALSKILSYKTT